MMFWYGGGGWAWWQAGLMWAVMIALWGLLAWAVYAVVSSMSSRAESGPGHSGQDARQILDQRLARGDIGPEEYERLCSLISNGRQPAGSGTGRA